MYRYQQSVDSYNDLLPSLHGNQKQTKTAKWPTSFAYLNTAENHDLRQNNWIHTILAIICICFLFHYFYILPTFLLFH